MKTKTIPIRATALGTFTTTASNDYLDELQIDFDEGSSDAVDLRHIAGQLRTSDVPIAFPTETVYGLGADATRSDAVKGIYKAKQRPSDNPLIVHFASLAQIRRTLSSSGHEDPIPAIYHSLIRRFWPGPLTILLPNPAGSILAPEVTAGLSTFGARIPRHAIALSLIHLADVPVAAPSANASTKPSPTAAEHVAYDLDGRIETIIDGGPCEVGVESTVVDGLSQPPLILRPGGVSLEQIRQCSGWEEAAIGYKDAAQKDTQPRAPGMKYRHYSPKAPVILYGVQSSPPNVDAMAELASSTGTVGVIRTVSWSLNDTGVLALEQCRPSSSTACHSANSFGFEGMLRSVHVETEKRAIRRHTAQQGDRRITVLDVNLGSDISDIARGIFGALRDLDQENVDVILVEGVDDSQDDDLAAAVMNRLRKAAETVV